MRIVLIIAALSAFAMSTHAASSDATLALGRKALLNEGVATAWRLSQQALAESPASAAAHEFAGEVLFRRGDFAASEAEFRAALKLDSTFGLAWWGLARIAECSSLQKTAAQYSDRAYELNPRDPRIFRDWALRLRGRQHIEALEKYASLAGSSLNEKDGEDLRLHIQLDRALNGRHVFTLASPYARTEVPLRAMTSETHMRVYGLEVNINGTLVALQLDTGASGILIPQRAANRAGLGRLADATFGGFGDNLKAPRGYHAIADRLRIGSVEFHDALISVSSQDSVGAADGLIGTDVFSDFLVTLNFSVNKLLLNPLPGYQPADEELHDRVISAEMQNFVRIFRFGHVLLLPTRVNDSREGLFVIDTGAAKTLISYEMAAAAGKINRDDKTRIHGINGQVTDVYQTGDVFLQFAGFRQKNLGMTTFNMWEQSRRLGTEVSGFLGLPLLNLFTLSIDYRDGLVNFERPDH